MEFIHHCGSARKKRLAGPIEFNNAVQPFWSMPHLSSCHGGLRVEDKWTVNGAAAWLETWSSNDDDKENSWHAVWRENPVCMIPITGLHVYPLWLHITINTDEISTVSLLQSAVLHCSLLHNPPWPQQPQTVSSVCTQVVPYLLPISLLCTVSSAREQPRLIHCKL